MADNSSLLEYTSKWTTQGEVGDMCYAVFMK